MPGGGGGGEVQSSFKEGEVRGKTPPGGGGGLSF